MILQPVMHNFVPEHTYENVDAYFPSPSMLNRRVAQLQNHQNNLDQSHFYQYSPTNMVTKRSLPNILQDDAAETHRKVIMKQRSASNVIELASGHDTASSVCYPHRQLSLPSFSSQVPGSSSQPGTLRKYSFNFYRSSLVIMLVL